MVVNKQQFDIRLAIYPKITPPQVPYVLIFIVLTCDEQKPCRLPVVCRV